MANQESFEKSLNKLEDIVEKLEEPDLPLDKSLKLFEDGVKQVRNCESKLSTAQAKVDQLVQTEAGLKKKALEL